MSTIRTHMARAGAGLLFLASALLAMPAASDAAVDRVTVYKDDRGAKLQVNGEDFMVLGMNWDYFPIGENYAYSLWAQPDELIVAALEEEMPLLKAMGVNAIRMYTGVPPRWVEYIYDKWGIYTVLNHSCARYGFFIDGVWIPSVDYSDPRLRQAVRDEVVAVVEEFKDTRGVLMWLLGNENNYGLYWASAEVEALPKGEQQAARARHLYSMFSMITDAIHDVDELRPVAICNGDIQFLDLIAEECPQIDIFGTNVYRGISVGDLYQRVWETMGVPVIQTEFGSDAWNAKYHREDQGMQCRMLIGQWQEIYEQAWDKGRVGNSVGGLTFQWSDGWWKFRQTENLDVHDTNASWPNGGYPDDFVLGDNNMNEEWWGICAKGQRDQLGVFKVYPRAAYYALMEAYTLDPYGEGTTIDRIRNHFGSLNPGLAGLSARGDRASLLGERSRGRLSGLRIEMETISTGGSRITTPEAVNGEPEGYPSFQGFDKFQSFYADFEANPSEAVKGRLSLNVLGSVPENPINEIFYENRGRRQRLRGADGGVIEVTDRERVRVYSASIDWDDRWFRMNAFFRGGHYHWGYEGDFFGLYREANYGENVDIYNGETPVGVEFEGKKRLNGLKFAIGPELWWGANPTAIGKYTRQVGPWQATAMFQEDIDRQESFTSTIAVPIPPTRKATLHLEGTYKRFTYDAGAIWSGNTRVGESFQISEEAGRDPNTGRQLYNLYIDDIKDKDTFGWKGKLQWQKGRWNWYAQGAYMGLVAEAGPTQTITYTGWGLKDSGSGNQKNFLTGLAVTAGNFQISPNFLWQKPIVGPIPADVLSPGRPRNVVDDPFAVRGNREMIGTELMITYDPTGATWMWQWDGVFREDARLAWSLGFIHRHMPTTQDVAIGLLDDGTTRFAFGAATPPRDLWEVQARILSKISGKSRLVANIMGGTAEPNGDDQRKVKRFAVDCRLDTHAFQLEGEARFNDFGPYDYHRDFNLTFPVQLRGDVGYTLGQPLWWVPQTKFGVAGIWRSLDENSPRYCAQEIPGLGGELECDTSPGLEHGREWEIRSYLHFAL